MQRVLEVWEERILPRLRMRKRILIVAHGNTLRALVKHLEGIPDDEIAGLNIPTGIPLVYELNRAIEVVTQYYLAEDEAVEAAMTAVANQAAAAYVS
jgi:2,3-bisphosphoglycerate-dependent phosphoglycerate mutase